VLSACFSADGHKVVTGSVDGRAMVWDAQTAEKLLTLEGISGPVRSAQFSPDDQRIVTNALGKGVVVWDVTSGKPLLELGDVVTMPYVTWVGYSRDGKRIVAASVGKNSRKVIVWDSARRHQLAAFEGHRDWIATCMFSPDGRRVLTASADGSTRLWDIDNGTEIVQLWMLRDGNWLAVTPQGYFAASDQARSLVRHADGTGGWIDDLESQRYRRPDLVRRAMAGR
jgi:WD40 repeat protein